MVAYYRDQKFNPVFIDVEDPAVWKDHVAKRETLYTTHLGIPLGLLKDKDVLEFGCNTGENALVLAHYGARLTLVEPNELAKARLMELFHRFGKTSSILRYSVDDVNSFRSGILFDVVIAEGFMSTIKEKVAALRKIISLMAPGGIGVVSFNDYVGGEIELTKKRILYSAYQKAGIKDVHSTEALDIARDYFEEDFLKLNASRTFETWWKDTLVSPVYTTETTWTYMEVFMALNLAGIDVHGTSPVWSKANHYSWYKNPRQGNSKWQEELGENTSFFKTGLRRTPTNDMLHNFLIREISIINVIINSGTHDELLKAYKGSMLLRELWGTPYHYISFTKPVVIS